MACILIIEDDPTIQLLFAQFLEGKGYTILQAFDGREGLSRLKAEKPDLVITDIMLPEMDGLEILMTMREEKIDVPVIAISGGMRDLPTNFMQHAKRFGARYVFKKPVPLGVLDAAVFKLLGAGGAGENSI